VQARSAVAARTLLFSNAGEYHLGRSSQGRVIYVSDDNFDGEDSFDYWITLATGEKLQGRVVLQVKGNSATRDLALTGTNSLPLTSTALVLLALGLLMAFGARRRRKDQ
jgi:hypothetical protein